MKTKCKFILFQSILILIWGTSSLHSERRGKLSNPEQLANQLLQKAFNYIFSKQSPDGAWKSEHYGLLKSGQSLTPFILHTLSGSTLQKSQIYEKMVEQAMNYLRSYNEMGVHGISDPDLLDYPNYSTSYALHCFLRFGNKNDQESIKNMINYLQNQQFSEGSGFPQNSPAHGGWGFGINQKPTMGSFVDLAHTRRILQSLNDANSITNRIKSRSEYFLNRLQKRKEVPNDSQIKWIPEYGYDGGFFSSPTIAYANKGRTLVDQDSGEKYFRSYATATCDGLLSMIALDYDLNSREIKDAKNWLLQNQDWALPSGVPLDDPSPWAESMKFYNLMALAEVHSSLQISGSWKKNIVHFLAKRQTTDGSFINLDGRLMKEDDPLISTTYAIVALNQVLCSN
ncbi:terpene cyclase/mutase family protein [Opitutales bacterium]|nr:terpene cyclase/mutase family protein [Opitutales bacterium]